MAELTFITPVTLEEMTIYEKEIAYLQSLIPFPHWSKTNIEGFMQACLGELTLVYLDSFLVASFCIELHPHRLAEIHGTVNPNLKNHFGQKQSRKLLNLIYGRIFNRVLTELNQRAVIAKVHPLAKGSLGFVRHYGFRKVYAQTEESIWVLKPTDYLNKGSQIYG